MHCKQRHSSHTALPMEKEGNGEGERGERGREKRRKGVKPAAGRMPN